MVTQELEVGVKGAIREQVLDAEIEKLREAFSGVTPFVEKLAPDGSEVAEAMTGGMTLTQTHGGKPTPKERVTIYATIDGEPRPVLFYMLSSYLKRRHGDGTPVFSLIPTKEYSQGKVLCFLHEDNPLRPLLDEIGLRNRTCPAGRIASDLDARLHGENRHPQSWRVWLEHKADLEKQEERLRWDALLGKAADKPKADRDLDEPSHPCPDCTFIARNAFGLSAHRRGKHKE